MYCKVCGKELPEGSARCNECGTPVDGSNISDTNTDSYYQEAGPASRSTGSRFDTGDGYYQDNRDRYRNDQYNNYSQENAIYEHQSGARKGFAIASMVLGIIGLVGTCCSLMTYGGLNILLGVLGLVFGILGLKSQGKGMAIAGIVMAALNIVIGILLIVLILLSMRTFGSMSPEEYEEFFREVEQMYELDFFHLRRLLP